MGKKSRLKRERRESAAGHPPGQSARKSSPNFDEVYQRDIAAIRTLLTASNAADVVIALGVLELWRPNRSGQVKHHLALAVALSTPENNYSAERDLSAYEDFKQFALELYRLLPTFPTLEDFVAEADWGEVRVPSRNGFTSILYGCNVERIADFIEAFRLLHGDSPQALADMEYAIALQGHIVGGVEASVVGSADDVDAGHVEVPSEEFWAACKLALQSACEAARATAGEPGGELTLNLGALRLPDTRAAFGDAIFTGTLVPVLMVRVAGVRLPVSPRSVVVAVIDQWGERAQQLDEVQLARASKRVGNFIAQRLRSHEAVPGPLVLEPATASFSPQVCAVLISRKRYQLILPLTPEQCVHLGRLEKQVRSLIGGERPWGLRKLGTREGFQIGRSRDTLADVDDVEIVALMLRVSTQPFRLLLDDTNVRLIGLPDLVTIFNSLKDAEELERFWKYEDSHEGVIGLFSGLADRFASFRDTNALLVEGAIQPTFIALDPHWNSRWRFKELKAFWERSPRHFPDGQTTWGVEAMKGGVQRLIAKGAPTLVWSGEVGRCTLQALMHIDTDNIDEVNGPILELAVHCLVDALVDRSALLSEPAVFAKEQIVVCCQLSSEAQLTPDYDVPPAALQSPLFSNWRVKDSSPRSVVVDVDVNVARLQAELNQATDAAVEAACAIEVVTGLSTLLDLDLPADIVPLLRETASRAPRFKVKVARRVVDVPDYGEANVPEPEQYKRARRDLAVALKERGFEAPSRYELAQAKVVIDAGRSAMRDLIHAKVTTFQPSRLAEICIEQHDRLAAKFQMEVARIRMSLSHQVSYDRVESLADAHERFTTEARNYRYLLECCLSLGAHGDVTPEIEDVVQIVASVDWLMVLYGASDTLHNDIDVGGIDLSDSYVPSVFFSPQREEQERQYSEEQASTKLGIGLLEEDEVDGEDEAADHLDELNEAFVADLGFSFVQLGQLMNLLKQWKAAGGSAELQFTYKATPQAIAEKLVEHAPGITFEVAHKLIDFLTLDGPGVRQLLGKPEREFDVPVWEHSKRGQRYLIRPLVRLDGGQLGWGAATVNRAAAIWNGSIANGYLPADFDWPSVAKAVRAVKAKIEKKLEGRAAEVCVRATPYAVGGVDFKRRFPKEQFDDAGDFDVLAYWPEKNQWLSVECKYNQPPFCLKDGRRLRDRIFGVDGKDRGHFGKIERRRAFLNQHLDRMRELLKWPASAVVERPKFLEAYVSRDVYWWMRFPPYDVPTEFVRIDALDAWLRAKNEA
jgi:hypothetical protein